MPTGAQLPTCPSVRRSVLQTVTRDASALAGSAPECPCNVEATFQLVFALGATPDGQARLSAAFSTCEPLGEGQAADLAYWVQVLFPVNRACAAECAAHCLGSHARSLGHPGALDCSRALCRRPAAGLETSVPGQPCRAAGLPRGGPADSFRGLPFIRQGARAERCTACAGSLGQLRHGQLPLAVLLHRRQRGAPPAGLAHARCLLPPG